MTDNAGLRAVISKAQVIDELENTLPGWVKRRHYMFPNYIHVLKARALLRWPCSAWTALVPCASEQRLLQALEPAGEARRRL